MLIPVFTKKYKKDYEKLKKQGKSFKHLTIVLEILLQDQNSLPDRCRDHKLKGQYEGKRECHIAPDWLLIYKKENYNLILIRMGSHSDLFS